MQWLIGEIRHANEAKYLYCLTLILEKWFLSSVFDPSEIFFCLFLYCPM